VIEIVPHGIEFGPRNFNNQLHGLIQELDSEAAVETRAQSVLPWRAKFDKVCRHYDTC
jgi:hypothetical protein